MSTQDQVDKLNELITENYDAEAGYKQVAERADHADLKAKFLEYARQRYDFGHEIKAEIAKLGGEVDKGSSVAAGAHRTWIAIKDMFTSEGNDSAILTEVIRGEEHALNHYNEIINELSITSSARICLTNQRDKIKLALGTMQARKVVA